MGLGFKLRQMIDDGNTPRTERCDAVGLYLLWIDHWAWRIELGDVEALVPTTWIQPQVTESTQDLKPGRNADCGRLVVEGR